MRKAVDELQEALEALPPSLAASIRLVLRFNTEVAQVLLAEGKPGVPTRHDINRAYGVLTERLQRRHTPLRSVKEVLGQNNRVQVAAEIILGIEKQIDFVNAEQAIASLKELTEAVPLPEELVRKAELLLQVLEEA